MPYIRKQSPQKNDLRLLAYALALCLSLAGCQNQERAIVENQDSSLQVGLVQKPGIRQIDSETAESLKQHSSSSSLAPEVPDSRNTAPESPLETKESSKSHASDLTTRKQKAIEMIRLEIQEKTSSTPQKEPSSQATAASTIAMPKLTDAMKDKKINIDLGQAHLFDVIKLVGDYTGINFLLDEGIAGDVTVIFSSEVRLGDLYNILESILEMNGYVAVPTPQGVKIKKRSDAMRNNMLVGIGNNPHEIPKTDTLITWIIPLEHAHVNDVFPILKSRMAQSGQIDMNGRTNKIIITDLSSNIHHIALIIRELDVPDARTDTVSVPLEFASAAELSQQIMGIMQDDRPAGRPNRGAGQPAQLQTEVRVQPDGRTNSVVVTANPSDTLKILDLIEQFDIEKPSGIDRYHVVPLVYATAKDVEENLTKALANRGVDDTGLGAPTITADESTNSLIVSASAQDFQIIEKVIMDLDIVRDLIQVEMQIIEISEDDLEQIGIDWATLDGAVNDSVRAFGLTNFGPRVNAISGDVQGLSIGAFKQINGETAIGSVLEALEKNTGINILSKPVILATNHQEAEIIVGENIPVVTNSRETESSGILNNDPLTPTVIKTFDYRDVGVSLKIKPHTSKGKWVRLDVDAEFTKLIDGREGQSVDTPTTAKRSAKTTLSMPSGETVVIGGLIRDDKVTVVQKIPLLGDIPLLGALFKWHRYQTQKTNLLIFITPTIQDNQEALAAMTKAKMDEVQAAFEEKMVEDVDPTSTLPTIWK
jgi:general secretion pathway protein D